MHGSPEQVLLSRPARGCQAAGPSVLVDSSPQEESHRLGGFHGIPFASADHDFSHGPSVLIHHPLKTCDARDQEVLVAEERYFVCAGPAICSLHAMLYFWAVHTVHPQMQAAHA